MLLFVVVFAVFAFVTGCSSKEQQQEQPIKYVFEDHVAEKTGTTSGTGETETGEAAINA